MEALICTFYKMMPRVSAAEAISSTQTDRHLLFFGGVFVVVAQDG